MPSTARTRLPAGENSPTRLVLFGVARAIERFKLGTPDDSRTLLLHEDEIRMRRTARQYIELAKDELGTSDAAQRIEDYDVAVGMARAVCAVTTLGWKIRSAAQGTATTAPSSEAWELLVMALTVAYVRAREANETYDLVTWVDELAVEISDL